MIYLVAIQVSLASIAFLMIRDEWQNWLYMLLAVVVVLWILALFGCASNDPIPPIQAYREAYGFPVITP